MLDILLVIAKPTALEIFLRSSEWGCCRFETLGPERHSHFRRQLPEELAAGTLVKLIEFDDGYWTVDADGPQFDQAISTKDVSVLRRRRKEIVAGGGSSLRAKPPERSGVRRRTLKGCWTELLTNSATELIKPL